MRRRRLLLTLLPLSLLATAACLVVAGLIVRDVVWDMHVDEVERDLHARAALIARDLAPMLGASAPEIDAAIKAWGVTSEARLTLIEPDGTVIADSLADPAHMENHAGRPEVRQARALGEGSDVHVSRTLGMRMVYVAMQVGPDSSAQRPVLRAAVPIELLDRTARPAWRALAAAGLAIMTIVATLAWIATRVLARPLKDYELAASRFAAGDFTRRLPVSSWHELAGLGEALNGMAAQLDARVRTIERQASEQAAVLSSMSEGVLAVDASERVISLNDAAATLLGASRGAGRTLPEVARHPELEALIRRVLETGETADAEIIVLSDGERHVDVHCTVLRDGRDEGHGAVAVLDDLTQVRRLEAVRRDFVANVSHELRTPVTSIKGFVETLREGAVLDPERAERFLAIVARQAERLSAIIDDLLTLARLEQEGREADVAREPARIVPLLRAAAQACELKAAERGTQVRVSGDDALFARVNAPLLEQAVINLVDNAVKHSEGRPVRVRAEARGGDLVIDVADSGTGIGAEHVARLFERFYRVDRARSRKEGGTGLGLAIVKHIARVHGGRATVTSEPGKGSTFTLTLPMD